MNGFIAFITDPPVAFLLGAAVATGFAWAVRKAETRELVNKMMRRREFEFAGRTWIAYAQGMTEKEKREWAGRLNRQAPPKPAPPEPPRSASRRTNKFEISRSDQQMLEFRHRFRLNLEAAGLSVGAAQTWDKAVYHVAEGLYGLRDAQKIIAQQFFRGALDRDELFRLCRLCPNLFLCPEGERLLLLDAHHGAPADALRGLVAWGAFGLAAPPPGDE